MKSTNWIELMAANYICMNRKRDGENMTRKRDSENSRALEEVFRVLNDLNTVQTHKKSHTFALAQTFIESPIHFKFAL